MQQEIEMTENVDLQRQCYRRRHAVHNFRFILYSKTLMK